MSVVVLVEVDVTSPIGELATLRFSDRAIRPLSPADLDRPNAVFDDRLVEAPALRRSLFDDVASLRPALGYGGMTLSNADQALDPYRGHLWGEARVWRWIEDTPFASATPMFRGPCATPGYRHATAQVSRVTVGLYDYRTEVANPLQTHVYAGSNDGVGVLYEGEADGLKGRQEPLTLGNLLDAHLPSPQVNAGAGVYQLHDGPVGDQIQIFDRGDNAGLTYRGDATGSAFDTFALDAAQSLTDVARGFVKINGEPVGQVTFGLKGDAAGGYVDQAGPIAARVLARMGVPPERIDASIANPPGPVVGIYVADATNAEEVVAQLGASCLAAIAPDAQGIWKKVAFGPPKAIADYDLAALDVIDLAADESAPLPAGEIRVGWGRIFTTFAGADLAPALKDTPSAERLAEEYRWAVYEDLALKARGPAAWRKVEIPTAIRTEAEALALLELLKPLFGLRPDGRARQGWRVITAENDETAALDLGRTIGLVYPPRSIDDTFLLMGVEPMRPKREQRTWTLWG
ncbi:hypothetical protein [Phenylobacterium sp.]|jgi:hypothetical protein|uniref:hypothetical protein n=1 Tax=Phenylobacterium sp. TaxID=1871053 RepID=UPI002F42631C